MWKKPIYKLKAASGNYINIDVTTSCGANLKPNSVIYEVADFLKIQEVKSILDLGAGALRHTIPLLKAGFEVWSVEFEKQGKLGTSIKL